MIKLNKKEIVDIRSFKIPLAVIILRVIKDIGYMNIEELIDVLYPKEEEYRIISEVLNIETKVDFDNLGIREELDVLNQLSLVKKSSGSYEITNKGKQFLAIYNENPKEIINKFYSDLRNVNDLFRIMCEKLEESNNGYVDRLILRSSHPKANKPKVNYFIGLMTHQFKMVEKEAKGIRLIRKIESPTAEIIGKKIISIYKRDVGSGLFLTINYLWNEIKKEFILIQEEDFDNAITFLIGRFPGQINALSGVSNEGDKVFVDKMTNSICQYLEIYTNVNEDLI